MASFCSWGTVWYKSEYQSMDGIHRLSVCQIPGNNSELFTKYNTHQLLTWDAPWPPKINRTNSNAPRENLEKSFDPEPYEPIY